MLEGRDGGVGLEVVGLWGGQVRVSCSIVAIGYVELREEGGGVTGKG